MADNEHGGGGGVAGSMAAPPVPTWEEVRKRYEDRWAKDKEEFQSKLRENLHLLLEQFRSGKQEVFQLTLTPLSERYIKAFRELFCDTGYQASVGDVESAAGGKKLKRLYITLPACN